jgi:heat shock protein HslJ
LRRALVVATAALVAATVVACSLGDDNANGGLANTSWTVLSIAGAATLGEARPTMTFAPDGTVSGSGGCNQYSGQYRTDGSAISVGEVSATLMGCDGERGLQEGAFLSALQGATSWRQAGDGNLHLSGAGDILAEPGLAEERPGNAPAAGLGGSAWQLVEMGGATDFAHFTPSIAFVEDGTVALFAGCNKFSGAYALTGADLRLGPLAGTKMACERPASAIEGAYLAALAGVTSWSIGADGRLTLGGRVPLTFEPD